MAEIKVLSSVDKTAKTGRPYKSLEVFCENEARKVNIFSSAPDFANIHQGSVIMGNMTKNGQYWEIVFDGQVKRADGASGGFKQAIIEKTMEKKEASIGKFQDNKELSIKVASTLRMAVDVATALTPEQRLQYGKDGTMQETIRFWREWFWLEWDNTGHSSGMPPF